MVANDSGANCNSAAPERRWKIAMLVAVVAFFALCDLASLPLFATAIDDIFSNGGFVYIYAMLVLIGLVGAQFGILKIWSVLGPGTAWQRLIRELTVGIVWLIAWGLGYLIAARTTNDFWANPPTLWVLLCVPVIYLAVRAPLWIARAVLRWRIESQQTGTANRRSPSLTIAELMLVTAAVALSLGAARLTDFGFQLSGYPLESFWLILGAQAAFAAVVSLLSTLPAVLLVLRPRLLWMGLAILLGHVLLVWLAYASVVCYNAPGPWLENVGICALQLGGLFAGLVGPLLLARTAGYRLHWGRTI